MERRTAIRKTVQWLGLSLSAPAVMGLLNGCRPAVHLNWEPKFFSPEEARLVGQIAETILPRTETPGALDLQVDRFVDLILKDCYPEKEQELVRLGLLQLQADCLATYAASFEDCSAGQQFELLRQYENQSWHALRTGATDPTFFAILKELTLLGYFTSETVMTTLLNYQPLPGRYDGCIPIGADAKIYVDNNVTG